MLRLMRKGQSTAEYAIVIGLVIAAAVAMQVYVKRGIQGKIKDAVDYNDANATAMMKTGQYEPYYVTSNMTNTRSGSSRAETKSKGEVVRTVISDNATSSGTQGITKVE